MSVHNKKRISIFERDNFTCQYCGFVGDQTSLHADHRHPVSRGGNDNIINLTTACARCNFRKGAKVLSAPSSEQLKDADEFLGNVTRCRVLSPKTNGVRATTLFQADISDALMTRTEAARQKFRLSRAEIMRAGLELICERLETTEAPFPQSEPSAPAR